MWRLLKGYEDYYRINICGGIYSLRNGINLSPAITPYGYYIVNLNKNGERAIKYVHRLVAENFIENPNNYPVVNHIDGNKTNNYAGNLEWTTFQGNSLHSYYVLGNKPTHRKRKVRCVELDKIFESISQAARELNIPNNGIWYCCQGLYKTAGGFHWEYVS